MYCSNCGSEIRDNAVYCNNCGSKANAPVRKKKGSKLIIFIAIAALLCMVIAVPMLRNHNVNSSPEAVTKNFFKAIYKEDADLLLKCVEPGSEMSNFSKVELSIKLHKANVELKNEMLDKWYDSVNIIDVRDVRADYDNWNPAKDEKAVTIMLAGEQEAIAVRKAGNKYYVKYKSKIEKADDARTILNLDE